MLQKIPGNLVAEKSKHEPSYAMKHLHHHVVYEFLFLLYGECVIQIEKDLYRITSGTFIMIPKGCQHKTTYLSANYHERIILYFSDAEMDWILNELSIETVDQVFEDKVIKIPEKRISYIGKLLEQIIYELHGVDEMSSSFARAYYNELFLFIMRCKKYSHNVIEKVNVANRIIQNVIDYICDNYQNDLTLGSVSKEFGMSESSLSKKFKSFTGFRFKEYISIVRIKAAENLLINTNKSITEISDLCGFNDSNFFGDSFKKINGISPNNFRKRL